MTRPLPGVEEVECSKGCHVEEDGGEEHGEGGVERVGPQGGRTDHVLRHRRVVCAWDW